MNKFAMFSFFIHSALFHPHPDLLSPVSFLTLKKITQNLGVQPLHVCFLLNLQIYFDFDIFCVKTDLEEKV